MKSSRYNASDTSQGIWEGLENKSVYLEECGDSVQRSEGTESGRRIWTWTKSNRELFQNNLCIGSPVFSHRKECEVVCRDLKSKQMIRADRSSHPYTLPGRLTTLFEETKHFVLGANKGFQTEIAHKLLEEKKKTI